ncbi:TPA: hypothetical protein N0F65_010257 [Lagenidium giganteum]|uniref:Uncharacterized protein n=1 Tax=Lagenidium giganteum TaxID=4803 RepID=A0AAV2YHP3_9STRA|nr:TPA: hypothetical protein N0F65_010257 [Lagenidium giganteum]
MARGLRIGSKSEVLKNLRELLRVTRQRSSAKQYQDCKWTQHILGHYRARQHEADREKMRAFRSEASDMLMLLKGVQEQRYLWDLDAGLDTKLSAQEVVDRSAKRVGLVMPETYADKEKKREEAAKSAAQRYLEDKRAKELAAAAARKRFD